MNSVLARVEFAIQEERVRQASALLCGASTHFDDRALARAAIQAMRDASPEILAPLAEMLARGADEPAPGAERPTPSRVERHALLIVQAWGAVIDAALELRRPLKREPGGADRQREQPLRARF